MADYNKERGYITIAQNSGDIDYVRMAYALALSLKSTQSEVSGLTIMVTPGTEVPPQYVDAFDEVIEIPWDDDAADFEWKIHNKWKVYHFTPYQETVLVDADMIFPTDVSYWWDFLAAKDVWFTTQPVDYRGNVILPGPYREAFKENSLPSIYTAFAYFKQSAKALELFEMARMVYREWEYGLKTYYRLHSSDDELLHYMAEYRSPMRFKWTHFLRNFPTDASGDLAFAIATKILGYENDFTDNFSIPTFTHMKLGDQNIEGTDGVGDDWTSVLPSMMGDNLSIQVGYFRQQYPFHYVNKDWVTDDMLRKLEDAANG